MVIKKIKFMVKCDIIAVTRDQLDYTKILVNSLFKYTDVDSRLIIVDNGSREDTRDYLNSLRAQEQIKEIKLIFNEKNEGAVKAKNQALKVSDADFVCFIDNDIEVTPGWLSQMIKLLERVKEIGMLSADSNSFGTRAPEGISLEDYGRSLKGLANEYAEAGQCATFCVLLRREVINKIGLFDEGYQLIMYEDTDYSMRVIAAGYICAITKGAYVWHYEHKTSGKMKKMQKITEENKKRYYRKWGKPLRIVCILNEKARLEECKEAYQSAVRLVRGGNFVYLFFNNTQKVLESNFIKKYGLIRHLGIHLYRIMENFLIFFVYGVF